MPSSKLIIPFREIDLAALPAVGGKNASIGELLSALAPAGVRVPDGFAITAEAFRRHIAQGGADRRIYDLLSRLDVRDVAALERAGAFAREQVLSLALPADLRDQVLAAYEQLSRAYEEAATDVAVRSSATAEDLPSASFAGQHESYLNVRGGEALLASVRDCMASLFLDRAIVYRAERGFRHADVALSVGVQKMVRSDRASAGVIFTLDTESGHRGVVAITGSWGLGESVVKGRVNPDEIWVFKPALDEIPNNVILASEFAAIFDGFSIGSNDLTQLALGVDRDSEILAHLFDERDPGVKKLIEMVTRAAHAAGRKVGLCGQAPSDHPEFAEFLAAVGLDSISVTEDALPGVVRRLAGGPPVRWPG